MIASRTSDTASDESVWSDRRSSAHPRLTIACPARLHAASARSTHGAWVSESLPPPPQPATTAASTSVSTVQRTPYQYRTRRNLERECELSGRGGGRTTRLGLDVLEPRQPHAK